MQSYNRKKTGSIKNIFSSNVTSIKNCVRACSVFCYIKLIYQICRNLWDVIFDNQVKENQIVL